MILDGRTLLRRSMQRFTKGQSGLPPLTMPATVGCGMMRPRR
jgi:hypothetical protein